MHLGSHFLLRLSVSGVASQPLTNYFLCVLCGEGKAMLDIKKYHINFDNKMKITHIGENPCWFRRQLKMVLPNSLGCINYIRSKTKNYE